MSKILMAHGSGGEQSRRIIEHIVKTFDNPMLSSMYDSAYIKLEGNDICFTTDTYVIDPPVFPGGDIGRLAVCGTVNDLAVCGAKPMYLSCAVILEEGLENEMLNRIISSMKRTADEAGVILVTGDIKVVQKGNADKIYINTSGIGLLRHKPRVEEISPGDKIIINGSIGDHSMAVLCSREHLNIRSDIKSDVAPLGNMIMRVLEKFPAGIRFMRDVTRGGLATVINEIIRYRGKTGAILNEDTIPLKKEVAAFCEILGLDPLYLANEGKIVFVVQEKYAEDLVSFLKRSRGCEESRIIGELTEEKRPRIILKTHSGGTRVVEPLSGEQLPRIC